MCKCFDDVTGCEPTYPRLEAFQRLGSSVLHTCLDDQLRPGDNWGARIRHCLPDYTCRIMSTGQFCHPLPARSVQAARAQQQQISIFLAADTQPETSETTALPPLPQGTNKFPGHTHCTIYVCTMPYAASPCLQPWRRVARGPWRDPLHRTGPSTVLVQVLEGRIRCR